MGQPTERVERGAAHGSGTNPVASENEDGATRKTTVHDESKSEARAHNGAGRDVGIRIGIGTAAGIADEISARG